MANTSVASTRFNRLQWRLIFGVFVAAALLGFYGQAIETVWARPIFSGAWFRDLSDALFVTLLYFTFSAPVDAAGSNLALHVVRFLAPFATVSAIIKIVIEAAYASWLQAHLKNQRGHVVIVGFGDLGQHIARQFLHEGRKVVALDRQPTSEATELAAHLAIPLVVGDGTRADDLGEAAARRADSIFFVTDNDVVNLEACAAASALMSKKDRTLTRLLVHLGNAQLSQQLQDYERRIAFIGDKRTAVNFFNLNDLLARQLLAENPLHRTAHWLCQDRLHVLIFGLNDISEMIIFHTLLTQRTHKLGKPHFTIIDPDASRGRKNFEAAWPGLDDIATMDFIDAPMDPARIGTMIREASQTAPLTATVLCLMDEVQNLTAALGIHSVAARGQLHAGNIMVRRNQTSDFFEKLSGIARFDLANLLFDFGEGDHQLFVRQITGDDDILARRIHEAYCRERAALGEAPSASTAPWDVLPESSRRSNRRTADFIWTKLDAVGYRVAGKDRMLPDLVDNGARLERGDIVADLARLEHDRWWADRVMDGWRYGPVRDNEARIHPGLLTFDDLDEETRAKDAELNAFLFSVLKETHGKGGTRTPIERTVGVEFDHGGGGKEKIAPQDCAATLCSEFPNEAFLVLCEAETSDEEAWLTDFVAALTSKGHAASLLRLFKSGFDEMLDTLDPDDTTLWLNLRATGASTENGYPAGMSLEAFLEARADQRLTVNL